MYLRHVSNGSNGSRLSPIALPASRPAEAPRMTFFKVVTGGGGGGGGGRWSRDESWVCVTLTHQGGNWARKGASLVF